MARKPWTAKGGRRKAIRQLYRHFIFCEDKKSAADYLRAFEVPREYVEVIVKGGAGNTDTVVAVALKEREKLIYHRVPYAAIWCVFDRDSFPPQNFNRAFDLARPFHDVHVIWANECFELWYLLHFNLRVTPIGRNELISLLGKPSCFGKKYQKANKGTFDALKDRLPTAIQNAKTLHSHYGGKPNPERDNPSTNVHFLVETLVQLGRLGPV